MPLESKERKLMLHYWYMDKRMDEAEGKEYVMAHGVVSGHKKLRDTDYIDTSIVKAIVINEATGEVEIHTRNSLYYCPLAYCDFEKQDRFPELLSDYDKWKQKYKDIINFPSIESGKVLLVFSNFNRYYFNSLCYIPKDATERTEYGAGVHLGMFQDSFLIRDETGEIDLRYFPEYDRIEFYVQETGDKPLFIENVGDSILHIKTLCGMFKVEPGERKEVRKENAEPPSR